MHEPHEVFFALYFGLLSQGHPPYPWQIGLFNQLVAGQWPDSVVLPTGAGKTSILKIWLIALGWSLINGRPTAVPRRLIWVVNRRVVVDQTTDEAQAVSDWLAQDLNKDHELTRALRQSSFLKKNALAISTLRGQKADNGEWSEDPLMPAIVVGTVDMIGSRLLFRGYRDGRNSRPKHAGLLGVDSLIVNDESHLTPAFATLLKSIERLRPGQTINRPFRTFLVSATESGIGECPFEHDIELDLAQSPQFKRVYDAEKRLRLIDTPSQADAIKEMIRIARDGTAARTIMFIEQPEHAARVAAQIEAFAGLDHVALLTGTMRGFERDQDQQNSGSAFSKFTERSIPEGRYFLVTTSAGEVGINMTSEVMCTVLVESDRLFQRLGRLNRFGDHAGEAYILNIATKVDKLTDDEKRQQSTLDYLKGLPTFNDGAINVSCRILRTNLAPAESRSRIPANARFEARLIDLWSQTSAPSSRMKSSPGASYMPPVDAWLHGKQDDNFPHTSVAWRVEVPLLASPDIDNGDRIKAINTYSVLPHEILTEPTARLKEKLQAMSDPEQLILFQDSNGDIEALSTAKLLAKSNEDWRDGLLILPPGTGHLTKGMLSDHGTPADDVADRGTDAPFRRRYLMERDGETLQLSPLLGGESLQIENPAKLTDRNNTRVFKIEVDDEIEEEARWLIFETTRSVNWEKSEIPLKDHLEHVADAAENIAALALGHSGVQYRSAGINHDTGKQIELWQKAMGGSVDRPLAKTKRAASPRLLNGYRHELHSYINADGSDDLMLHLIASHHGWARPYWEAKACPPDSVSPENKIKICEATHRFARMQKTWGPWGLAYLEALFKAADILGDEASANG
jgi:CRISPR-associated endonuclease/helicase Cas3